LLLAVVGVGQAGERDILRRLKEKGGALTSPEKAPDDGPYALALFDEYGDDDLAELCELRGLRGLYLSGATFTDKGLRQLKGMSQLVHVRLLHCPNITTEGVVRLQRALPNCRIDR
jgi:hypothetical protein